MPYSFRICRKIYAFNSRERVEWIVVYTAFKTVSGEHYMADLHGFLMLICELHVEGGAGCLRCAGQVQVSRVQDERTSWRAVDNRSLNQLRADRSAQHWQTRRALDQAWHGAAVPARRLNVVHLLLITSHNSASSRACIRVDPASFRRQIQKNLGRGLRSLTGKSY